MAPRTSYYSVHVRESTGYLYHKAEPPDHLIAKHLSRHFKMSDYDVEAKLSPVNNIVDSYGWSDLNVQVKDRNTKQAISILRSCYGNVKAGEMVGIMGPSGSGKTTLLNAIAHRTAAAGATTSGDLLINGHKAGLEELRSLSTYVEQEDALLGSLTVRETMWFASGLFLSGTMSKKERAHRVDELIRNFGLQSQANTIVGTPIRKGLSGGQKKRLGVASRLVTSPQILFLDEPTSGLDSTLSFEVIKHIKTIAKQMNLIVIASIHQPSTTTFKLFDKLCLLAKGRTCYFGPLPEASNYFARAGYEMPMEINPAEYFLDLINTDLGDPEAVTRMQHIAGIWPASPEARFLSEDLRRSRMVTETVLSLSSTRPNLLQVVGVLLHRSWVKAYRDIVAYHIRIVMYLGLAIMMGVVFLRFEPSQEYIQPYINAIFFGGAFMSFMAVAYVPAFLEDLQTFRQERANGLVGPLAFSITNFLIGLPFLFIIVSLFSIVAYFLIDFRQDATAFFKFLMWLFLDLVAAESLVVLVSSVFPIFVVALAVTAFANGMWMCVDGFLVPLGILNAFWKYWAYYIDYQAYVFRGMLVNEFQYRTYDCAQTQGEYQCMYPSDLASVGKIRGTAVLKSFSIDTGLEGTWVGIIIGIIVGYRILAYLALALRRR